MTLFRVVHNKNYTVINNTICTDNRISFKAKGIWLYAFSRPDDWKFYLNDLIKQSTDRESSVSSGLKELENAGYLRRIRHRDEKGRLGAAEWTFLETPFTDTFEPKRDFPIQAKPIEVNPPLLNTDSLPSTETTNPQEAKPPKDSVVSSFLDEILDLKDSNLTPSQRKTLQAKYSKEQVVNALKAVDLKKCHSHFGILIKAIENSYEAKGPTPQEIKADQDKKTAIIKQNNYRQAKNLEDEYAEKIPFDRSFTVFEERIDVKTIEGTACLSLADRQSIEILKSHIYKNI